MPSRNRVETSPYALLWPMPLSSGAYTIPVDFSRWGREEVSLLLAPEDTGDEAFLSTLSRPSSVVVAYERRAALCDVTGTEFQTGRSTRNCKVGFAVKESDFIPSIEASYAGVGADELASLRARRLLLDERPEETTTDINEITRNLFIGGHGTLLRVDKSIFPGLYEIFGTEPTKFLEIAWIHAAAHLQLTACVSEISVLELTLEDDLLGVFMVGSRRKKGGTRSTEIRVRGQCSLGGREGTVLDISDLAHKLRELSVRVSLTKSDQKVARRAKLLISELDDLLSRLPPGAK
jgi:hypothetical protein